MNKLLTLTQLINIANEWVAEENPTNAELRALDTLLGRVIREVSSEDNKAKYPYSLGTDGSVL